MSDDELEKMAKELTISLGWDNREWDWKEKDQSDAEVFVKLLEFGRTVRDSVVQLPSQEEFIKGLDECWAKYPQLSQPEMKEVFYLNARSEWRSCCEWLRSQMVSPDSNKVSVSNDTKTVVHDDNIWSVRNKSSELLFGDIKSAQEYFTQNSTGSNGLEIVKIPLCSHRKTGQPISDAIDWTPQVIKLARTMAKGFEQNIDTVAGSGIAKDLILYLKKMDLANEARILGGTK